MTEATATAARSKAAAQGRPIWYELMTPDPAAGAPFYRATLGWDVDGQHTATPSGHDYWMIGRADGGHAGGVIRLTEEMQMSGGTAAWIPYFDVDDVDAAAAKAQELGARVWLPPMKMDVGTMAMLGDPQGASFYLMDPVPPPDQPDAQSDVFAPGRVGHCQWNQLDTTDEPAASAFYRELFGWDTERTMPMGEAGVYRFIAIDGQQIGAVSPGLGTARSPGWLPFFRVADIDDAKAAAEATGGTVLHDIHQVPSGDFIFRASDPGGAQLGLAGPRKGA